MLKLHFLGQPKVETAGEAIIWPSEKIIALLAYLAITAETYTRPQLEGLLWGESEADKAKMSLRTALYNINKALDTPLAAGRKTVAFDFDKPHCVDVVQFRQALESGHTADLQAAVALVRGEFLQGIYVDDSPEFENWLLLERERLRHDYLAVLRELIGRALAEHDNGLAIEYGRRLLAVEPWHEDAHRQLMLLLARQGQFNEALRQYQQCRALLADELGVGPTPETEALAAKIAAARTAKRDNLPVQRTPFYGRETTIKDVQDRLSEQRLITLVGVGGSGKTRLALEIAQREKQQFLHGVAFVQLAAVSAPAAQMEAAVARAIVTQLAEAGMCAPLQGDATDHLLEQLAERELLLVLDNFEQLLEAAPLLDQIYAQAADVALLVTSRERLALLQEQTILLDGLAYPADDESTADWENTAGVQLFVNTARRVKPDFVPTETAALLKICRLVDGLPLALEMTAVWASQQSCGAIAQQLADSLDVLTSPYRNLPARQRSMRVVFRHSWERLTEQEQLILTRCAVFYDPFSVAAAEEVAEATSGILAALAQKALVSPLADGRYQLHPLWRQFLRGEWPEVQAQTAGRHARYFAQALAEKRTRLEGRGQAEVLPLIGRWENDLFGAWRYAIAQNAWELTDEMIYPLFLYCERRNLYDVAAQLLGELSAVLAPIEAHEPDRQALALAYQAWMIWDLEPSLVLAEKAYALCQEGTLAHAQAALVLSSKRNDQLDFMGARRLAQEAVDVARPLDDRRTMGRGYLLMAMGAAPTRLSEPELEAQWYEAALSICQEMGDKHGEAIVLHNIGWSHFYKQNYEAAEPVIRTVCRLFRELNVPRQQCVGEMMLARALAMQGALAAAEVQVHQTLALAQQLRFTVSVLQLLTVLATEIYPVSGRVEEAVAVIGFLAQHPSLTTHLQQHLEETAVAIEAQLPDGVVTAVKTRGRSWRLETVVRLVTTKFAKAG